MDKRNSNDRVFINHYIKVPKVLCINQNGENLGIINTFDALKLAKDAGLDLVQINPPQREKPAIVKILDYGKFKYDESKKKKEADRKQREAMIKDHEVKLHPNTQFNDLQYKAKKAEEFLADGDRVKVSVVYRGREISHKELGWEVLNQFLELTPSGQSISNPSFDGKALTCTLIKKSTIIK